MLVSENEAQSLLRANENVLILILLDVSLGDNIKLTHIKLTPVLILILLDVSLGEVFFKTLIQPYGCLNPYSTGC